MNFDQAIFGNSDMLATTKLTAVTIQTWANRGILALSAEQRNPGVGQKRLYSGMDIMRIVAMKALMDRGLSTSSAAQIALRLQALNAWRKALEQSAPHVHVFIIANGTDVKGIRLDNDAAEVARVLTTFNEATQGGVLGRPETQQTKTAVFDIGPEVHNAVQALRGLAHGRGAEVTA